MRDNAWNTRFGRVLIIASLLSAVGGCVYAASVVHHEQNAASAESTDQIPSNADMNAADLNVADSRNATGATDVRDEPISPKATSANSRTAIATDTGGRMASPTDLDGRAATATNPDGSTLSAADAARMYAEALRKNREAARMGVDPSEATTNTMDEQ